MQNLNTGGPAFPDVEQFGLLRRADLSPEQKETIYANARGMSLRQYAAIKLRVPDSGTDWLDDMIRTSLRDGFAAQAMELYASPTVPFEVTSRDCYAMADSMLAAREAKP